MLDNLSIPSFLLKLRKLVDDPETRKNIYWHKDGKSFIIDGPSEFAQNILPLYFKHRNISSFVRQLNMYGFHKVSGEAEALRTASDMMQFSHPNFIESDERQLLNIKKKQIGIQASKSQREPRELDVILTQMDSLKDQNQKLESKMNVIQSENKMLLDGYTEMRVRLQNQSNLTDKLLKFLVQILQNNTSNKRKRQSYPVSHATLPNATDEHANFPMIAGRAIEGPTIHEVRDYDSYLNPLLSEATNDTKDTITKISEPAVTHTENDPSGWILNDDTVEMEGNGSSINPDEIFQTNRISRSPGGSVLDNENIHVSTINEFVDQMITPNASNSTTPSFISQAPKILSTPVEESSSKNDNDIKPNFKHILVGRKPNGKATTVRLNRFPATSRDPKPSQDKETAVQPYQSYINEDKLLSSASSMPLVPNFPSNQVDASPELFNSGNMTPEQMKGLFSSLEELVSSRELKFDLDFQTSWSMPNDDYSDSQFPPPKSTGKELSLYTPAIADGPSNNEDNKARKKLPKLDLEQASDFEMNNFGLETPKVSYEDWDD